MKFSIERKHLLKALAAIYPIIEKKKGPVIAILEHILIEIDKESMTASLVAMNGDMMLTRTIPIIDAENSSYGFAVLATTFYDIVRKFENVNEIIFELSSKNDGFIEIKSENCLFVLTIISTERFPKIDTIGIESYLQISASDLLQLLKQTQYAISSDETRMHLGGVHLHISNENCIEQALLGEKKRIDRVMESEILYVGNSVFNSNSSENSIDHTSYSVKNGDSEIMNNDGVSYIVAVATDAHRLAISEKLLSKDSIYKLENGDIDGDNRNGNFEVGKSASNPIIDFQYLNQSKLDITIPKKTVIELISLLEEELRDELEDKETILSIGFSSKKLHLKTANTELSSKLIDIPFPHYRGAIRPTNYYIVFSRQQLIYGINLVTAISESKIKAIELKISGNICSILVENQVTTKTSARHDMEIETNIQNPISILVNGRYLLESVNAINSSAIAIWMPEKLNLLQIGDCTGNAIHILMPIQHQNRIDGRNV